MNKLALLLPLIPFSAAAAAPPDVERPDFSASREVVASLDAMIGNLQGAAAGDPTSWQVGRALGNCQEIRRIIARWPDVGAYDPRGAERLWQECKTTYDAVR